MSDNSSNGRPVATALVNVTNPVVSAPACASSVSTSERNISMFASTISLGDLRVVTATVRVATLGNVILLGSAKQEVPVADGRGGFAINETKVPVVPTNSIFGNGEYVRIQYGKAWFTVKSLVLADYVVEPIRVISQVGGEVRHTDFFAVRGVDKHILDMCRYGKNALPATVAKTAKVRATSFIEQHVINPGTTGVGVWTPWASSWGHDYDQVGFGVRSARKLWKLVVAAAGRKGIEVSEHVQSLVMQMPWLLNEAPLFVNRQPVHDSENLAVLRIVVTDVPFAAPTVTPELMKSMGGDEDGDPCALFTGEDHASVQSIIDRVLINIAGKLNCGPLNIFGAGYLTGDTSGTKGGKSTDVSLHNVKYTTGNVWNDFMGFKVKSIIGMLCTAIWQYAWAFRRRLTEAELVEFGNQSIAIDTEALKTAKTDDITRLNKRIAKMAKLITAATVTSKYHEERVAQLALEITYRVFRDLFEHVFDARKGEELSYDPMENLNSLSRTGRFDWAGMEAAGLWTTPLKLVSSRIWQTAISLAGNPYPRYSLRDMIAEHDAEYFMYVSDRANGWIRDQQAVVTLMEKFQTEGLDSLIESLYLQKGYVEIPVIDVPAKYSAPLQKGDLHDLLEDAVVGRKFHTGPSSMNAAMSYLASCGVNVEIIKDAEGSMYLSSGNVKQLIPTIKVVPNVMTLSGSQPDYVGHTIHTGTTVRACPPVLVYGPLNPYATNEDVMIQKTRKDKFPGINPDKFFVLNFYGVLANLILGAAQEGLTTIQFIRKACARITNFINKLELVKNDAAESVFAEMLRVELRRTEIGQDWYRLTEDYTAKALYEAGFSLYAVSKNSPMSKFVKINKDLGVPSLVAAYDVFWPLRTERRFDREAVAVARQMRNVAKPIANPVKSTHGLEGAFAPHRQMVVMAFFNSPDNKGGHDPVDFTPSGMEKSASDDITWVWMSLEEKNRFIESLSTEDLQKVRGLLKNLRASGREVMKYEQIDEEIEVPKFCVPVEWGVEDTTTITFKGNFAGTKSQVKPMGRQLVASYTPIKSYNTLEKRLLATDKSQVILVDGVMPADTVVAKGAWSLIAQAAASRLNDGFVLDTHDPEEIVTRVIPSISTALEAEGKPGDGKMYIYRLGDDTIEPVTGPDGKVLRAVVGSVPMYRIPFESDFNGAMTKYRRGGGIAKLGHIERGLVGEIPTLSQANRVDFALAMHDLKQALENLPTNTVEFEGYDYEEEYID